MKLQKIQCLVGLLHNGQNTGTVVGLFGPDAVTAPEIPILRSKHDLTENSQGTECAIQRAVVVGEVEVDRAAEYERLVMKYGRAAVVAVYPQSRLMPATLEECDLPPSCLAPVTAEPEKVDEGGDEDDADAIREKLVAAGVKVPNGDLSLEDLKALAEEAGVGA